MIEENCLDGVDEVYGLHNVPNFDEGDIRICEGAIMAAKVIFKLTIKGKGGHGSTPHKIVDAITCASKIY